MTVPNRTGKGAVKEAFRSNGAKAKPGKGNAHEAKNDPSGDEPPFVWPTIIPLSEKPKAMPFPLEVLPGPLQDAVREIATALNAPPDFRPFRCSSWPVRQSA